MQCSEHVGGSLHYQPLRMHASLLPVFFFLAEYQLDPCMKRKGQPHDPDQPSSCMYIQLDSLYIYIYIYGQSCVRRPIIRKREKLWSD